MFTEFLLLFQTALDVICVHIVLEGDNFVENIYLRISDEEELFWAELGQSRKSGFRSKLLDRVLVSPERLVKTAVVSDVLALSQNAVQLNKKIEIGIKSSFFLLGCLGLTLFGGDFSWF
jgi:hypothetical protein